MVLFLCMLRTCKKQCGQGTQFIFRRLRSLCQWVSCCLCRVCEVQKLCFPVETCLRTRMTPRRLLLKRQEPHICGETVFLTGSSPLRRRLKKEREGTLHFFRRQHVFFIAGWPSTSEWRKNPHPPNVLNTPPCWQLQKSEDLHPSNSSDPSYTFAVRDTGEGETYSTVE